VGFIIDEPTAEPFPNGFWKSLTTSGRSCGIGFYCYKCHLLYLKSAPNVIRHCGGITTFDAMENIPTHRLGSFVCYAAETERLQAMRAIVDGEMANIAAERAARIDMLEPTPTIFKKAVTFLRGLVQRN
jgi:hypothetical protein